MEIRILAVAVLAIPAFFLVMRYHMHMFQLNGYKNGEHLHWLKKNIGQQWLLPFGMLLGAAGMILPCMAVDAAVIVTLVLMILDRKSVV